MDVIVKGSPSIEIGFESKVVEVGGLTDIDSALSTESENPVQNKVITAELSSLGDSVASLESKKADKDGVYSGMTVGRSIDLLGVEDVEEGSFLFRPTDGDGSIKDGVAVVKSVKGESVVWNQCFSNGATNKDYLKWEGNKATINGEFDADNVSYDAAIYGAKCVEPITNHKYLVEIDVISGTISGGIIIHYLPFADKSMNIRENQLSVKTFVSSTITSSYYFARTIKAGVIATNLKVVYRVTDLTQMFGVGNEPSTIEDFNARMATLCIEDMNAYNAGEVVNMKASGIKSVGFNAWDEEWESGSIDANTGKEYDSSTQLRAKNYIRVLPNAQYYAKKTAGKALYLFYYDEKKNFIISQDPFATSGEGGKFTTPQGVYYMRLRYSGPTYNNDICINLVHSGYRNGEYEPYVEDVLALPTLDLFPNGMNKIGDVYDEYDDEKSVQRIGIRPYQSGDESIENVLTDGTSTLFVLEEPIVTPHKHRLAYKAWDFGTEQVIADGNTTAITAGITYEFNARDTIRSNKTRLDVLEPIVAGKIDKVADDYYPQLAVGLADNLSGVDVVDSEVNFRRSGGGAISDGVARIEAIKGNSVVWNQLYPTDWIQEEKGVLSISQGGVIQSQGTLTESYWNIKRMPSNIEGHKYLFEVSGLSSTFKGRFSLHNRSTTAQVSNGYAWFIYTNNDTSLGLNLGFDWLTVGDVIDETYEVRVTDLTQMFQAGNEPTTIEEFYARVATLGVDLNAYNEGEVIHCDVQSIESQGVNAWDEEWELGTIAGSTGNPSNNDQTKIRTSFIKVLPNTSYYNHSQGVKRVFFYDADKTFISYLYGSTTFATPSNCHYIRLVFEQTTYNHDICINISDTSINGKYFPYIKRVEDLSIIRKYFPDGMKSAGTAHDEIRYNKASGKWEKVVRIGEVDMGTLNWKNLDASNGMFWLSRQEVIDLNMATHDNENIPTNLISSLYASAPTYDIVNIDKVFRGPFTTKFSGYLTVKDTAYTDAATFKAAMAGVILYYELAEPIVTELDAEDQFRDLDYQVWNCGTEKAIAEGKSAPLAADITYGFNAIGKIKELEQLVKTLTTQVASLTNK